MIILGRVSTRYLQSELPRYDPSLLRPLQPCTLQLLRVLVVPITTKRVQLVGELEAEDLRALVGLQQCLLTGFVGACLFKLHHLTAR